ncbi:MAG: hypothetical protein KAR62_01345 [Sphingomonadales bacterium]|nr:hypothetical protein [Sphingomonadales bacterium]
MTKLTFLASLASIFILSACVSTGTTDKEKYKEKPVEQPEQTALPENAPENMVKAANGQLFIALNTPVSGCQAYRPYAPAGRMVVQVIYYQHAGKVFSPIREGAICN